MKTELESTPISTTVRSRKAGSAPVSELPADLQSRQGISAWLQVLFEGHPDMLLVIDASGSIVAVNSTAMAGFGYGREEMTGQSIAVLVPEAARMRHADHVEKFLRNPTQRAMGAGISLKARHAAGSEFPVDVMLKPFTAGNAQYVMAVCRRLDAAEVRSQLQIQALVESVRDYAINLLDAQGRILTWNEGSRRIHGLTATEALGQNISIFFLDEAVARGEPAKLLEEAERTGHCHAAGWRKGARGKTIWAEVDFTPVRDVSGQLTGFTRVLHDLTSQKESEDGLRRLNAQLEQYRLIVENVEDYAIYTLDAQGRITSWGPGAQKTLGYTPEQVLGRHYSIFSTPEDLAVGVAQKQLDEAARNGRCVTDNWRVRGDGSRQWSSGVITAVRDDAGSLTGFIRVTRNMTRQKMLEDSLAKLNADLEQRVAERTRQLASSVEELRRKNEEVESFSRIVSRDLKEKEVLLKEIHHRVKNNLQVVQSLLKMSARRLPDCDARTAVESTVERVHAMSMVHERLYQMPSLSALPLGDYLSDIFGAAIQSYSLAPSQVRLSLDVEEILLPLDRAVPFALLSNEILSNSFKHGFPDGRTGTISVSVHRADGAVHMVIEDDGVGLPDGFDASTSNSMGLKLAANLAHQLGGSLEFTSNPGCRVEAEFTRM
jgi:PAS domain S-box-containing protein